MRIGLLTDIHGNLPALDAALRTLRSAGVNAIVVAGDTIGYGPFPNECIDAVRANADLAVVGNHELFVMGRGADGHYSPLATRSLLWTKERLGKRQWNWLHGLPRLVQLGTAVVTHGSLASPHEYVVRPTQVANQMELLRRHDPGAEALVLGHTHTPMYKEEGRRVSLTSLGRRRYGPGSRVIINPGSVGQSRQWELLPHARFAILDVAVREVRWFAVRYDHNETLRALVAAGLPASGLHARPTVAAAVARVLRRRTDFRWRARSE